MGTGSLEHKKIIQERRKVKLTLRTPWRLIWRTTGTVPCILKLEPVVIFFTWPLYHQKIMPVLCIISGFCCNVNELHSSGILYWVEWKFLTDILVQLIGPKYKGDEFFLDFSMLCNSPEEHRSQPWYLLNRRMQESKARLYGFGQQKNFFSFYNLKPRLYSL